MEIPLGAKPFEIFVNGLLEGNYRLPSKRLEFGDIRENMSGVTETVRPRHLWFKVLPGTTHAFDHSLMGDKPVVMRQGGQVVTYRYNRESVEATWKLMLDFLGRHAGGSAPR